MTRVLVCIGVLVLPTIVFAQPRVATPTFSVPAGDYSHVVLVEVRVSTVGATIRFTQNGLDPTESDPIIASGGRLAITTTTILKAKAFMHGRRPSEVRTAVYQFVRAGAGLPIGPGHVDAAAAHSLLATPDGRVLAWTRQSSPRMIDDEAGVVAVAAGRAHALALTQAGHVLAWGANQAGQLGDRTRINRKRPVRVEGLRDVVQVAAGRSHSLALTADGRVWAWGSNNRGQLGLASPHTSTGAEPIPGLSDVAAIEAGDMHSVAITRTGAVFAWGANSHGQLGNGTRTDRRAPVRIAVDPVTAVAAGGTHTLVMSRDGTVHGWGSGSRGELGTGAFTGSLNPVVVNGLTASAIRAGRHFSAAVSREGTLLLWGANDAGQLGDGTLIDRANPVAGPAMASISALALGGRHALAVTASGDVWTWGLNTTLSQTMSDVQDWGPPIVPEATATPIIEPPSGAYPAPQTVTLSGAEGTTVRYTLDGSDPSSESPAYSAPFVVAVNGMVKARAYPSSSALEPSDIVTATYVIDMSPPVITAHASPPIAGAWMTEPVTITFACSDDSGTVSCPAPITVATDGALQLITGDAVDPAGNRTTASLTVSVDLTPPAILLDASPDNGTTSATHIVLSGRVFDHGSGLSGSFHCNGIPVAIIQEVFECDVALQPGVNSITLQAADVAGHLTAGGIVIARVGEPTQLAIAPDSRTMTLNEVAPLTLSDEFGAAVKGAEWSSSDPAVAVLSSDDPPLVTALAAGTVSITATKGGLSATAAIHVDAAEVLLPGQLRWSIAPAAGKAMGAPIFTHRVDPDVPEMFLVETIPTGEATLRAVTADGAVLWKQEAPGAALMGDSFGGVVTGVYVDWSWDYFRAYVRLGNAGGIRPWRYDSPGALERPAQAADGTIYAIEHVAGQDSNGWEIWDKYALAIDGTTGRLLVRHHLLREVDMFTADLDGQVVREKPLLVCRSTREETPPASVGPVVGSDGRGYVLVRRQVTHKFDTCIEQHGRHRRSIDNGVDLLIMSADAAPAFEPVFADACEVPVFDVSSCDVPPVPRQIMPDGIGGVLLNWDRFGRFVNTSTALLQRVVTRRNEDGGLTDMEVANTTWIDTVGQAGISYVFAAGAWSAVDVTSWTPKWTANLGTFTPLAAHPEGGAALYDALNGVTRTVDSNGAPDDAAPVAFGFHQRVVQHAGSWIGVRDGQLAVVAGDFPDATRFYSVAGNAAFQRSVRRPGMGIYLKTQNAVGIIPVHHTALWVVPTNQFWVADWYQQRPELPVKRDEFRNLMFTVGAGLPDGRDSTLNCAVPGADLLVKGINRAGDLAKPARARQQLPIPEWEEASAIARLLAVHKRYSDQAPYACLPDAYVGFYNSNSYVHSLLEYAQVPHDARFPGWRAPGWSVLIPESYFDNK